MYKLYRASFAELEAFTIMFSIKKPRIQKKYHILIVFRYYTPALSADVVSSGRKDRRWPWIEMPFHDCSYLLRIANREIPIVVSIVRMNVIKTAVVVGSTRR